MSNSAGRLDVSDSGVVHADLAEVHDLLLEGVGYESVGPILGLKVGHGLSLPFPVSVQRPVVRTMRKRALPDTIRSTADPASASGISSIIGRMPVSAAKLRVSSTSRDVPDW